jgi:sugar/nucleoside kinase (ribokinase family)
LPSVDYFMPSLEEAAFLSGRADPADAAAFFLDKGAAACVFKMGAQGSYARTRGGAFRTPAFKVPVSDTTGCGDAYCGGFVAGLAEGRDLEGACRLGAATAALVATGLGSDAGVRDREQVEAFIATAERLP